MLEVGVPAFSASGRSVRSRGRASWRRGPGGAFARHGAPAPLRPSSRVGASAVGGVPPPAAAGSACASSGSAPVCPRPVHCNQRCMSSVGGSSRPLAVNHLVLKGSCFTPAPPAPQRHKCCISTARPQSHLLPPLPLPALLAAKMATATAFKSQRSFASRPASQQAPRLPSRTAKAVRCQAQQVGRGAARFLQPNAVTAAHGAAGGCIPREILRRIGQRHAAVLAH